jgi:hypothetical protein
LKKTKEYAKIFLSDKKGIYIMKYDLKKLTAKALIIYAAVNVFTYLFAHLSYLFSGEVIGDVLAYVSYYLTKSVEFLAPPLIASVALPVLITYGKGSMITFALSVATARILYALPYYYLIFIYSYGYDSIESIALSLAASIAVIAVTAFGIVASLGIYYLVLKRICKKDGRSPNDEFKILDGTAPALDFLSPRNLPALTFALARFAYSLALEIFDTVAFFIEYRSDYQTIEIVTILVNFILLFALLIASYLIATKIKNMIIDVNGEKQINE